MTFKYFNIFECQNVNWLKHCFPENFVKNGIQYLFSIQINFSDYLQKTEWNLISEEGPAVKYPKSRKYICSFFWKCLQDVWLPMRQKVNHPSINIPKWAATIICLQTNEAQMLFFVRFHVLTQNVSYGCDHVLGCFVAVPVRSLKIEWKKINKREITTWGKLMSKHSYLWSFQKIVYYVGHIHTPTFFPPPNPSK